MTIVPRTGPLSASSALATTSWYQRGKSSDWGVSTVLAMASILGSVWMDTRAVKRSTPGLGVLHGGDQKGLPRLPRVGELARATSLLEYACGGVSGHVVESPLTATSVRPQTWRHMAWTACTWAWDRRMRRGGSGPNRPMSTWMWLLCAASKR